MRQPNLKQEWREKFDEKLKDRYALLKEEYVDFFYNLHQEELQKIRNTLAETIDDTSLEAQLKFWQKPSDYQKGLVENLKEKGLLSLTEEE